MVPGLGRTIFVPYSFLKWLEPNLPPEARAEGSSRMGCPACSSGASLPVNLVPTSPAGTAEFQQKSVFPHL